MARINGSGFKMNKSPLTKNIFTGKVDKKTGKVYNAAEKRAKFRGDVNAFGRGLKKGAKAVDAKLQQAGEYLSSKSINDRRAAKKQSNPTSGKVNKQTYVAPDLKNEVKIKTNNNLAYGTGNSMDLSKTDMGGRELSGRDRQENRLSRGSAAGKSLVDSKDGPNNNFVESGNYGRNKKTKNIVRTKVSVKKPKTTDLSKTTGVKAPKKAKATAKQQGVLEKQITKTNASKPKVKATVKNQGILEKAITKPKKVTVKNQGALERAITKPKKVTVKNKAGASKKATTTTKRSKSGRKAGESQYQYNVRVAMANRKLKKSIKTSQTKSKPDNKKVDLTKKKGLGPRA
tara:strand:- start:326 stop:1357 length:1032 start_codon:yes stop_codon:yes gene_type:complete